MKDDRSVVPQELNHLRSILGDAGIPHSLRRSKNGWPYIRFVSPVLGTEISFQFRRQRRRNGVYLPAHFLAFIPGGVPGTQTAFKFNDLVEVLAFVSPDPEALASGREARKELSFAERVVSVLEPQVERSYLAMMKF